MITGDRDEFLGAHTTPKVKEALDLERRKTGKSVSLLIHEAVKKEMQQKGYQVEDQTAA